MTAIRQYIVDAFAPTVFQGNPAAVCVLDAPLPDATMLKIAQENRLSETAFLLKEVDQYHLRWFTPAAEVDLCGHATLGSAYVVLQFLEPESASVRFTTKSGLLEVKREGDGLFAMDFPSYALTPVAMTDELRQGLLEALGNVPTDIYQARDLVCVFEDEAIVRSMTPDFERLLSIPGLLVHVTAPSHTYDYVARSFAPKLAIDEDPVCGSGHCHLIPYWAKRLGKADLFSLQASERSGELYCEDRGARVTLKGKVALFSEGTIHVPNE